GLAFALARVAEGLVEVAIGALFRVADDAVDDALNELQALFVDDVALDLLGLLLALKHAQLIARFEGALHRRLELRQRHPAERLVGRERLPSVDDAHYLFQRVFWLTHE